MTKRRALFLAFAIVAVLLLLPGIGRSIQRQQALAANVVLPPWTVGKPMPGDIDWAWDIVPLDDHVYLSGVRIDKTERNDGRAYHFILKIQKSDGAVVGQATEPAINTGERSSLANTGGITDGGDGFLYAVGLEPGVPATLTQGLLWKVDPTTMKTTPFAGNPGRQVVTEPGTAVALSRVKAFGSKLYAAGFSYPTQGNTQGNTDWHLVVFDRESGKLEQSFTAYASADGNPCNDEVNGIHVDESGVYLAGQVLDGACDQLRSRVLRLRANASGKLERVAEWTLMNGDKPALADGWAIAGSGTGEVLVLSRYFRTSGALGVDWRMDALRPCSAPPNLCSVSYAESKLNDGPSYTMPRAIAVHPGDPARIVTGGFRRDLGGRQCTELLPRLGPTCWNWRLEGWTWSAGDGFHPLWTREAYNGPEDKTGLLHSLAIDPNGRDYYAAGCINAAGPHDARGCFLASQKSEVGWDAQWLRGNVLTGQ